MKKNKRHGSLWIIGLIFFVGVAIIIYPTVSNLISSFTADVVITEYTQQMKQKSDEEIEEMLKKAQTFNEKLAKNIIDKDLETCLNNEKNVMCQLEIPKIKVYLPVYFGTSEEVLENGCGYMKGSSLPVGGESTHSSISGHTGLPTANMLTDLDNLEKGDMFYIHVLNETLAYQVDDINVVEPYETEKLDIVKGKDYVTLVTCTPYGINDHRLLVRGTRVPYNTDSETIQAYQLPSENGLTQSIIDQIIFISGVILIAIIAFIIAVIVIHKVGKKKNTDNQEETKI